MNRFLMLLLCLLAGANVAAQAVFSRRYMVKSSDGTTTTRLKLYKNDVVLVHVSGQATYGVMAAMLLGRVGAAGIADQKYQALWGLPAYRSMKFGAVVCRVGADFASAAPVRDDFRECLNGPFSIGVCQPVSEPVTGTLFVVRSGGELVFDINDQLCLDNRGIFSVEVFVLPATAPLELKSPPISGLLCGLVMGANPAGDSYDESAMSQIVLSGNTGRLKNLSDINSYYRFLNEHPAVRMAGIRWQQVGVEVSGLLLLGNELLEQLRSPSGQVAGEVREIAFLLWASYLILISEHGKTFIDGTASQGLAHHITENFYRPLLRGDFTVVDPVAFDVAAVYGEQFNPTLQASYRSFNRFDRILVEGSFSRFYARQPGCHYAGNTSTLGSDLQIGKPADRLRIGLYKMGYSAKVIQQALLDIEAMERQGLQYPAITERLKQRAVRMTGRPTSQSR